MLRYDLMILGNKDKAFMFCTNCGNQIADSSKFCRMCGTPVDSNPNANFYNADAADERIVSEEVIKNYEPNAESTAIVEDIGSRSANEGVINNIVETTGAVIPGGNIPASNNYTADAYKESYFDGTGLQLLGHSLLAVLLITITLGFATPWMICRIYRWRVNHTVINGKRLVFTGSGTSLLGHYILWSLLTVITCGIYGFFMYVAIRKWEVERTYLDGEPIYANTKASYFDGGSFAFFGYQILTGLLFIVTLGIGYPWVMSIMENWDIRHQVLNGRRLKFNGSGGGFFVEYLIIFLLSIITLGIYGPWAAARLNRYVVKNTEFDI